MASYKDSPNIKFNPYVQTLPVEAMAKVGMYKQQRYDQGVEKIQKSIDNIAGLDIVRPEDKQYLQSKLNQLGSQLTNVAGGDFSNFALVSSVNGMTNQIVKDPGVMNAVSNTARYKKDLEAVEKLNTEGKWAPSNQAAFQKDVNKWFNNPSQDAKYSSNISPYVDVTKDSVAIIKALASKVTTSDVAVEQDSKGNYVIYDAITRRKVEGISKERIATALKTGLSPQAYRQLAIDGQYKYSGTSPDQYISDINSKYQEDFLKLTTRREKYTSILSSLSPDEQNIANQKIRDIDAAAVQLKNEYDSVSSGFESGDVDGSQAQYYTMNYLDNTSNAYASETQSTTFHTSPFKTQENFERKFAQTQSNWDAMYAQKLREFKYKKEQDGLAKEGVFGDIVLPPDTEGSGVERSNTEVMMDALNVTADTKAAVNNTKQQLYNLGLDDQAIIEAAKNPSAIEDANIRNAVIKINKLNKKLQTLTIRDTSIEEMANELYKVPTEYDATVLAGNNSYGDDTPNEFFDDTGGYQYIEVGGEQVTVNDIATMIRKFERSYPKITDQKFTDNPFSSKNYYSDLSRAKKELKGIERVIFDNLYLVSESGSDMMADGYPDMPLGEDGYSSFDNSNVLNRATLNRFVKGADQINSVMGEVYDIRNTWMEEQYVNQEQVNLIRTSRINKDNFKDIENTIGQLITLANSAESGLLPTEIAQDGDVRSASEMSAILENGVSTASVYTNQDGSQGLIINGNRIPIPVEQFQLITKGRFNPSPRMQYYNNEILPSLLQTLPELMEVENIVLGQPVMETVAKPRGYYTTSVDGEYDTNTINAQYSTNSGDFPQLTNSYRAWMNFSTVEDPNDTESLVSQMMVMDPMTMELTTLNFQVSPERAVELFDLRDSNGAPLLEQLIYQKLNASKIRNNEMPSNINDATIKISENKTVSYRNFLKEQAQQYDN